MSDHDNKVIEVINHYQEALNRYVSRGEEHRVLHCLTKLRRLPITVSHLEETGVGRTVNSLRKVEGEVGEGARTLVNQWKEMVEQDTQDDRETDKDEMEDGTEEVRQMEECTENIESASQNDIESVNLNSDSDKRCSNSKSRKEKEKSNNESSKFSKHKEKEKKHERGSKKHESSAHKSGSKSKRKYADESSKTVDENTENSDESSDRKKRKSDHKHRDNSPKKSKELENKHAINKGKPDQVKEKHKVKKDKHREEELVDIPQSIEDETSHRKESSKEIVDSPKTTKENRHSHRKVSSKEKGESDNRKESSIKSSNSEEKMKSGKHDKREKESKRDKNSLTNNSKSSPKNTPESKVVKNKLKDVDSIDSGSGASFAEALGMLEPLPTIKSAKKKSGINKTDMKSTPEPSTSSSKSKSSENPSKLNNKCVERNLIEEDDDYLSDDNNDFLVDDTMDNEVPSLLTNLQKLEPLEINISSLLPTITPNYRPVANNPFLIENPRHKSMTEYENLTHVITMKNARTKVYSGNKVAFGKVPSLFELSTRVLMDNIDALEYTGGVPFMILKPVLEKCTAEQLKTLEHYNHYLLEDTDELWNFHCQKEFRNKKRDEWESARDMYLRCVDEREVKLRALTANIKQSLDKSLPVRQTKLAYVDSVAKPPRGVARKQQKNGYTNDIKSPLITPSSRLSANAQSGSAGQVCVPNLGPRAAIGTHSNNTMMKIKKAPLMQKTLQLMKGRFRR